MGKLIKFPKTYKGEIPVKPPQTKEELNQHILDVRCKHTEFLIGDVTTYMLNLFRNEGIFLSSLGDIANVDINMIQETLRATILRFYHIQYPFQNFANARYAEMQKQAENVKEIEDLNPAMKTEVEPEPEPEPPAPMVG